MNLQVVKWAVDLAMGIAFLACYITGMFKFTYFMRLFGLTSLRLPIAQMSNMHDWSGLFLGLFVAVHLILNRGWIITMTKKVLSGTKTAP